MQTIYEISSNNYWTGISKEIEDATGCDINWTRTAVPSLSEGEFAVFESGNWLVTSTHPSKVQIFNPVDPESSKTYYSNAIQKVLDDKAKEYGYDNILSACTYKDSSNEKFAKEGQAFYTWRDVVWSKVSELLEEDNISELISNLPVFSI